MHARWFVLCVVLVSCSKRPDTGGGNADPSAAKANAKARAQECVNALVKGDYETFVDATHPKAVEGMGGREKMVEKLRREMKGMKDRGYVFESVKLSEPSDPLAAGEWLYLVIPFDFDMTTPKGRATVKSALVGMSSDDGKTWVFIDANPGRDAIKKLFPELPDALPIPEKEPPVFHKG